MALRYKSNKYKKPKPAQESVPRCPEVSQTCEIPPPIDLVDSDCCSLVGEEDVVPYCNAKKYEYLKMKITSTALRYSVLVLFLNKYQGLDGIKPGVDIQSSWSGRGGLVSKIKRDLGLTVTNPVKILPILMDIVECARCGKTFDTSFLENRGGTREHVLKVDSSASQVIADCLESGLSVEKKREILNNHRLESGLEGVSRSAVDSLVMRMKPKIEVITKRKQGSKDPQNPWSRARLLWSKKLLIRFGELPTEEGVPHFNQDLVGKLELDQVVWWDETHRKCLIGGLTNRNFTMKFKRDENGKLDFNNGKYDKKKRKF